MDVQELLAAGRRSLDGGDGLVYTPSKSGGLQAYLGRIKKEDAASRTLVPLFPSGQEGRRVSALAAQRTAAETPAATLRAWQAVQRITTSTFSSSNSCWHGDDGWADLRHARVPRVSGDC